MEQKALPNSTLILILGILSIVSCCCYGVGGLLFGGITLFLASKATNLYNENPEMYTGYSNVKTGKLLGIIGLVISALYFILWIIYIIIYGFAVAGAMMDPSMYY